MTFIKIVVVSGPTGEEGVVHRGNISTVVDPSAITGTDTVHSTVVDPSAKK